MTPVDAGKSMPAEGSALAPLRHLVFSALWTATVVSNIGTWMQNAAAGWLMAGLTRDALVVSLVQVATMLPVVLLGCRPVHWPTSWTGAKLLIAVNGAQAITVATLGLLVWLGRVTPEVLLIFTPPHRGRIGADRTVVQAIVPSLVPRQDLQAAISLNSVGIKHQPRCGPCARRHHHRCAWAGGTVSGSMPSQRWV